ncbi:hypothetical protein U1Q18_008041 [Sarracenia purpurea var. burkii]
MDFGKELRHAQQKHTKVQQGLAGNRCCNGKRRHRRQGEATQARPGAAEQQQRKQKQRAGRRQVAVQAQRRRGVAGDSGKYGAIKEQRR